MRGTKITGLSLRKILTIKYQKVQQKASTIRTSQINALLTIK